MKKIPLYFLLIVVCLYWTHSYQSMATLSRYSRQAAAKVKFTANRGYQNIRTWMGYRPESKHHTIIPTNLLYQPSPYTAMYGTTEGQHAQTRAAKVESNARDLGTDAFVTASTIATAIAAGTFSLIDPIYLADYWVTTLATLPPLFGGSLYGARKAFGNFELAMAKIKNAARKRFMTDFERINTTYQQIINTGNVELSNIPTDIINKSLLPNKLNLLQAILINKKSLISDVVIKLLDAGMNPNVYEPGTPHPIECLLNNRNPQSNEDFNEKWNILLALVNPNLVPSEQLIALPKNIEDKLIQRVQEERQKAFFKTIELTNKNSNFIIKNNSDVYLLEVIITLDQIIEALKLRNKVLHQNKEPL